MMITYRDLTSFDLASRMLSEKPNSRFENFMHESVQLGSKATVSAGCIVGKGSILGDKCSVKRSIIGSTCKLGNNVKIMSSIVMDDVIVEEGSHIQNSIICSGSHLKVRKLLHTHQTDGQSHRWIKWQTRHTLQRSYSNRLNGTRLGRPIHIPLCPCTA